MLPGNGPSGSGSVLGVGTPNSPNALSVTAAVAFVDAAVVAAIAAAPLISCRRLKGCLSKKVSGVVMDSSLDFRWEQTPMAAIRHIAGDNLRSCENRADFRWREELDRVPAENIGGTIELVERRFQRRHRVLRDGLRRPALAALHRAQRTVLAEQENLVHAHAEDLTGDVLGSVAEQVGCDGSDLFRSHLLDLLDACLLGVGLRRN